MHAEKYEFTLQIQSAVKSNQAIPVKPITNLQLGMAGKESYKRGLPVQCGFYY